MSLGGHVLGTAAFVLKAAPVGGEGVVSRLTFDPVRVRLA